MMSSPPAPKGEPLEGKELIELLILVA
jgi:hypothetical protein